MAKVGRKPKPTALKKVTGNPGRRRLPDNEPEILAPEVIPNPPAHLSGEALDEWHRHAPSLHGCGILTLVDVAALAAYCQLYGRWVEAERALALHRDVATYSGDFNQGFLVSTPNGASMQHPLVGVANTAARDMMKYAAELGMTPSARTRVQKAPQQSKSKAAKYLD